MGQNHVNWMTELVTGTLQIGTQLDGLNHLQIGDRVYNGWRTRAIAEDWGTNRLGIETVPPVITRGILVDATVERGVDQLEVGDLITVAQVESFLKLKGIDVRPGDAVIFHTGWGRLYETDGVRFNSGEPGVGMEVAEWLVGHGVALTGADTWSFGAVPGENPERPFQVPQILNAKHGVLPPSRVL